MVIETRALNKIYRGAIEYHALYDIELQVERGEMVAIMGASGSGKSTLMNILGCLDRQSSGQYHLDGVNVSQLSDVELARIRNQKLGFVFQNFHLLARYSALQNVELPLIYAGMGTRERSRRATAALASVGLADRLNNRPNELSGGQKQRVAVARAMVNEPALLMADEPTGALDSRTSRDIMRLFQALHAQGLTLLIVTHEPDIAAYCQRIIRMTDGRIVEDNRIEQALIPAESD
ncbi:MAG: macrolide ABC transporter ATP-binding protein [Candidatus Melainabacteria bacterium HGW-Melainabacteria-1]|nr:MAG: macrolide ABC transporter ATP-binding protein [Candidatus Melainabacteria bacterium HGW-Melainabacteria-1]